MYRPSRKEVLRVVNAAELKWVALIHQRVWSLRVDNSFVSITVSPIPTVVSRSKISVLRKTLASSAEELKPTSIRASVRRSGPFYAKNFVVPFVAVLAFVLFVSSVGPTPIIVVVLGQLYS